MQFFLTNNSVFALLKLWVCNFCANLKSLINWLKFRSIPKIVFQISERVQVSNTFHIHLAWRDTDLQISKDYETTRSDDPHFSQKLLSALLMCVHSGQTFSNWFDTISTIF